MMSDSYKIEWLGFNEKASSNRVWGHIVMKDGRNYVFWGVRGHTLDFKFHRYDYKIPSIITQHEKNGYKKIDPDHYELISPNFKQDLEIWFMAYILKGE